MRRLQQSRRRHKTTLSGHGSNAWQHQLSLPKAFRHHRQHQARQVFETATTCNKQTSSSQQRGITITQGYNRTRKGKHRRLLVHQRPAQRQRRQHLHQGYGQCPTTASYSSVEAPSSSRPSTTTSPFSYSSSTKAPSSSRTSTSQTTKDTEPPENQDTESSADQDMEQASSTTFSPSSLSSSSSSLSSSSTRYTACCSND